MNNTYNNLTGDRINEDEGIYTIGDDILHTFMNGNYTDGINDMIEACITPEELAEYLEEKAEEYDMKISDMYYGHFTLSFFGSIGQSFRAERVA